MTAAELIAAIDRHFLSRRDVYAEGYPRPNNPEKFTYAKREAEITDDLLLQHLKGEVCLGVYQMAQDSTVKWFAIDFDAPKDASEDANALDAAWRQLENLQRAGLHAYVERSRSGKGAHVWGFLSEPVEAGVVRRALKPLMVDDETFDRLYPLQDGISESKPYGNLIMLPFYGKAVADGCSVFVNDSAEVINPRTFIAEIQANPPAVIEYLASKAPKASLVKRDLTSNPSLVAADFPTTSGALKVASEYGCQFLHHCFTDRRKLPEPQWYAAIQIATQFDEGRNFAHLLSRDYKGYSEAEVDQKFDQALSNHKIGCAFIHENFPKFACKRCPRNQQGQQTAPHHLARLSTIEFMRSGRVPMERAGSFRSDLERISQYDSGEVVGGIPWGFPGIDELTRLRNKEMTVVGGAPSLGKTYLMTDAAYRLAAAGVPVFVFSAETGMESLRQRLLGRVAEVDTRALRGERKGQRLTSGEWKRLEAAGDTLAKLPIYLNFTSLTADDVLLLVEGAVLRDRIPLDQPYVVFFDYLQYGPRLPGEDSDYDRISRLSSEFKAAAKLLNRPVIVFSQLVRDAEGEDTPKLTWFRGSGRIEQDLDVGVIITGERMHGDFAPRSLWFVKQREGLVGKVDMILRQTFGRWDEAMTGLNEPNEPPLLMGAT